MSLSINNKQSHLSNQPAANAPPGSKAAEAARAFFSASPLFAASERRLLASPASALHSHLSRAFFHFSKLLVKGDNALFKVALLSRYLVEKDPQIAAFLLEMGIDVKHMPLDLLKQKGRSPLALMCHYTIPSEQLIGQLLALGLDINEKFQGKSALHGLPGPKLVRLLYDNGGDPLCEDDTGKIPLVALMERHFSPTLTLEDLDQKMDAARAALIHLEQLPTDQLNRIPLAVRGKLFLLVCALGDETQLRRLCRHNLDLSWSIDSKGYNGHVWALHYQRLDQFRYLRGYDVNLDYGGKDNLRAVMEKAIALERLDLLEYLYKLGGDDSDCDFSLLFDAPYKEHTPLNLPPIRAPRLSDQEVADKFTLNDLHLLQKIDAYQDDEGKKVRSEPEEVSKFLRRIDPRLRNTERVNSFMQFLAELHAMSPLYDKHKRTLLTMVIQGKDFDLAKRLLNKSSYEFLLNDEFGKTALDYACDQNWREGVLYILQSCQFDDAPLNALRAKIAANQTVPFSEWKAIGDDVLSSAQGRSFLRALKVVCDQQKVGGIATYFAARALGKKSKPSSASDSLSELEGALRARQRRRPLALIAKVPPSMLDKPGQSVLALASNCRHYQAVRRLVEAGVDVNNTRKGLTSLHIGDDKAILHYLYAKGADPLLRDPKGQLPIELALERKSSKRTFEEDFDDNYWGFVLVHLDHFPTDRLRLLSKPHFMKLCQIAAAFGTLEQLKKLLCCDPMIVKATDDSGKTLLSIAYTYGRRAQIQLLESYGASIQSQSKYAKELIFCAMSAWGERLAFGESALATMRRLVAEGVDYNRPDALGVTPLGNALSNGQDAIAEYLINLGCDLDAPSNKNTPLHLAFLYHNKRMVELLISRGASFIDPAKYLDLACDFAPVEFLDWALQLIGDSVLSKTMRIEILQFQFDLHKQRHLEYLANRWGMNYDAYTQAHTIIAHLYSVAGKAEVEGQQVEYEGASEALLLTFLNRHLLAYFLSYRFAELKKSLGVLKEVDFLRLSDAFKAALPNAAKSAATLAKNSRDRLVILPFSTRDKSFESAHGVYIGVFGDTLLRADRATSVDVGCTVDHIENSAELEGAFFQPLITKGRHPVSRFLHTHVVEEDLATKPLQMLEMSAQIKAGNCCWSSLQAMVLGALYLELTKSYSPQEAKELAYPIYRDLMVYIKGSELLKYIRDETITLDYQLLHKVVEKLSSELKEESYGDLLFEIKEELIRRY